MGCLGSPFTGGTVLVGRVDWGNCIPSKLMGEKLFMLFSPFSVLLGVSEFFFCCSCFCMLAVSIPIFFTLS